MSSLFDIPQSLALILALAAADGGPPADRASLTAVPAAAVSADPNPYRFTDQSFMAAIESGAGGAELADVRRGIFRTSSGRYYVPSESERRRIQVLKRDSDLAALLAFSNARRNVPAMKSALGRRPEAGELYLAHVIGTDTAVKLIRLAQDRPLASVSSALPEVAAEFPEIGKLKGTSAQARTVYERLSRAPFRFGSIETAEALPASLRLSDEEPGGARLAGMSDIAAALIAVPQATASLDWTAEIQEAP